MTRYLLIHGSWHGAWCWYKIGPRLKADGHQVIVPDLLGRASHRGLLQFVSLERMLRQVATTLAPDQKTTIVVHSRYGVLAPLLAERFPEKIARVIYLASFMLPDQQRAATYFRDDRGSTLRPFITISKAGMWDALHPDIYREGLYHDCAEEDVCLAASLLCREPLRPALTKLSLSAENFGRVPRAYIRLTEDRAVTPALQDRCINEVGVDRVEDLKASHSAYFSMPNALTETIRSLCRT